MLVRISGTLFLKDRIEPPNTFGLVEWVDEENRRVCFHTLFILCTWISTLQKRENNVVITYPCLKHTHIFFHHIFSCNFRTQVCGWALVRMYVLQSDRNIALQMRTYKAHLVFGSCMHTYVQNNLYNKYPFPLTILTHFLASTGINQKGRSKSSVSIVHTVLKG